MGKKRKTKCTETLTDSELSLMKRVHKQSSHAAHINEKKFLQPSSLPTKVRVLVERIINRITRHGTIEGFSEQDILDVLEESRKQLRPLPSLLYVKVPVVIFGDIHGQLSDLQRFLALVGTPPQIKLLFLGDYIDRCNKGIEVALLLLCYKLRYPNHVDLLRGNHECQNYGFYAECRAKSSVRLWKAFQRVFYELPLCARVGKRILAMHGGISPDIKSWESLSSLKKPRTNEECDKGIPVDLMWSDPSRDECTKGFQANVDRGTSYIFGDDAVREFNNNLDIDIVVRAHEVVRKGHLFNANQQMCTIFSAPNYCGSEGNCASAMCVSKRLEISFATLKPRPNTEVKSQLSKRELLANQERFLRMNAKSPKPGTKHHESVYVKYNDDIPVNLENEDEHTAKETDEKPIILLDSEAKLESPGSNHIPDQFDFTSTVKPTSKSNIPSQAVNVMVASYNISKESKEQFQTTVECTPSVTPPQIVSQSATQCSADIVNLPSAQNVSPSNMTGTLSTAIEAKSLKTAPTSPTAPNASTSRKIISELADAIPTETLLLSKTNKDAKSNDQPHTPSSN